MEFIIEKSETEVTSVPELHFFRELENSVSRSYTTPSEVLKETKRLFNDGVRVSVGGRNFQIKQ